MFAKPQVPLLTSTKTPFSRRIDRRNFLEHAIKMGLTGNALLLFLESCNNPFATAHEPTSNDTSHSASATGPVDIEWESEHDPNGTYSALVNAFNKINKHGIHVTLLDTSSDTQHEELVTRLQAHHGSPDIISMDIIWTDEFAHNKWVIPLDDLWPVEKRRGYLATPIEGATYQGQLWAAPFRTDVGLLYYRTDLCPTPPTTWKNLIAIVHQVGKQVAHGYIWQGKQYEGLVCNFVEVLSSYGAYILDPNDSKHVVVNNAAARTALNAMKSWIGTVSPSDTKLYDEDMSNAIWLSGDALFMRNWPTYIAVSNDASYPKVAQKFGVAALPNGAHSCLGGWGLGISAFSKKQAAAWEFIQWMLQEDTQKFAAIDASFAVTLESIYNDNFVRSQNPFYEQIPGLIKQAQLRPQSFRYPAMTTAIQAAVYSALVGSSTIDDALVRLQKQLEGLV